MTRIITDVSRAVELLRSGELVAFPTETVYGLGADAKNVGAVERVFAAKGRPIDHPLIVHVGNLSQISEWAREVPENALRLARAFWPGSLTMVLPKQPWVADLITAGLDTVALRMPNHPVALDLLQNFGSGLVGPSANRYQYVSPTCAQHVMDDLGDNIAAVLDGGACNVGVESTIVQLADGAPRILRRGVISEQQIEEVLGRPIELVLGEAQKMHSPGSDQVHYAPRTKLLLIAGSDLVSIISDMKAKHMRFSVLSFSEEPSNLAPDVFWQSMPKDAAVYGREMYASLRHHDNLGNDYIICEKVPELAEWLVIVDRLKRASHK